MRGYEAENGLTSMSTTHIRKTFNSAAIPVVVVHGGLEKVRTDASRMKCFEIENGLH